MKIKLIKLPQSESLVDWLIVWLDDERLPKYLILTSSLCSVFWSSGILLYELFKFLDCQSAARLARVIKRILAAISYILN